MKKLVLKLAAATDLLKSVFCKVKQYRKLFAVETWGVFCSLGSRMVLDNNHWAISWHSENTISHISGKPTTSELCCSLYYVNWCLTQLLKPCETKMEKSLQEYCLQTLSYISIEEITYAKTLHSKTRAEVTKNFAKYSNITWFTTVLTYLQRLLTKATQLKRLTAIIRWRVYFRVPKKIVS